MKNLFSVITTGLVGRGFASRGPQQGHYLRIYSTTIPAVDRRVCLMQDALYRNDVTHRSMGTHISQ